MENWRLTHEVPDHLLSIFQAPVTSRQILEYLERLNLFIIPLDNVRQWYRYHSLFADLLRQQMGQKSDKQAITSLYQRASQWYEENDMPLKAIEHALAATDYPRMARLMEVHGQRALWEHGHYVTVTNWLDALPNDRSASAADYDYIRAAFQGQNCRCNTLLSSVSLHLGWGEDD